jgi:hypothetical protein
MLTRGGGADSLRTELVQHIYSPMTQRVPFFNLLASSVDSEYADDFLAKITTLFEYKTYTPGQAVPPPPHACSRAATLS